MCGIYGLELIIGWYTWLIRGSKAHTRMEPENTWDEGSQHGGTEMLKSVLTETMENPL